MEDNRSVLDRICETIADNRRTLAQVRDLTYNLRSEMAKLRPLTDKTEEISLELEKLKT